MEHVTACYWQRKHLQSCFCLCSNENTVGWESLCGICLYFRQQGNWYEICKTKWRRNWREGYLEAVSGRKDKEKWMDSLRQQNKK